jgi:hypothetical protein
MYQAPDAGSPYELTVEDLLADGITLADAARRIPADQRINGRVGSFGTPEQHEAASVLRYLHEQRASEIIRGRPCPTCSAAATHELLAEVTHPLVGYPVRLLDAIFDLSSGLFPIAVAGRSLTQVVDAFYDAADDLSSCSSNVECRTRFGDPEPFAVTLLGVLAGLAFQEGLERDTGGLLDATYGQVVAELRGNSAYAHLPDTDLTELACQDPRVVAAGAVIPDRWADSDWDVHLRVHDEPLWDLDSLQEQFAVPDVALVRSVVMVAVWLATLAERDLCV